MKKLLIGLLLCLFLPAASYATQKDPEQLIRSAPVPAEPPYQGEFRLLHRDSALVAQTLLNSKVMSRVVGAIQKRELNNWPKDREGGTDSRRYTGELVKALQTVEERAEEGQRFLQLMIEFVLDGKQSYVALYAPTLTQKGDRLVLQKKELLKKLPFSRTYVYKNILFIIQDCFQLEVGKALELVRPVAGYLQ
ncbi:MAG: hypothetical protein ACOYL3_03805 [Desulfuromonadaceae bacterium]